VAELTLIAAPRSGVGPIEAPARTKLMAESPVAGKYDQMVDSDSAHEMLARRAEAASVAASAQPSASPGSKGGAAGKSGTGARRSDTAWQVLTKSLARQLGGRSGRALIRGILGSLLKGR
jgi:hypothetical protein